MMPTTDQLAQQIADLTARLDAITTPSHAAVVNQMQALLTKWQAREDQMRQWISGTALGGPNSDGKFPLTDAGGFTRMVSCPDQVQLDAAMLKVVQLAGAGPFDMTAAGHGNRVVVISWGADVAIGLPAMPIGTQILFIQGGDGRLTFYPAQGEQLLHRQSFNKTAGKGGMTTVIRQADAIWSIGGDMSF